MDPEQWLTENTFHCEALRARLTAKVCAENRAKPAWNEEGATSTNYRPAACTKCTVWPDLASGLEKKGEDNMGGKHSVKVCVDCKEEKEIIGRGRCGKCYQRAIKTGVLVPRSYNKKTGKPSGNPGPDIAAAVKALDQKITENYENVITLNFSEQPEIYKQLCDLAADEIRDPDDQVLWILKKYFRPGGAREESL
jgi:hypothetical protein